MAENPASPEAAPPAGPEATQGLDRAPKKAGRPKGSVNPASKRQQRLARKKGRAGGVQGLEGAPRLEDVAGARLASSGAPARPLTRDDPPPVEVPPHLRPDVVAGAAPAAAMVLGLAVTLIRAKRGLGPAPPEVMEPLGPAGARVLLKHAPGPVTDNIDELALVGCFIAAISAPTDPAALAELERLARAEEDRRRIEEEEARHAAEERDMEAMMKGASAPAGPAAVEGPAAPLA